jgi:hypothetical protein
MATDEIKTIQDSVQSIETYITKGQGEIQGLLDSLIANRNWKDATNDQTTLVFVQDAEDDDGALIRNFTALQNKADGNYVKPVIILTGTVAK